MAGLIFLWQNQAAPLVQPPPGDAMPVVLRRTRRWRPPVEIRQRGAGDTTLSPVQHHGSGNLRRMGTTAAIAGAHVTLQARGVLRRTGSGSGALASPSTHGAGTRRRSGRGSLALTLMSADERDALVALASGE